MLKFAFLGILTIGKEEQKMLKKITTICAALTLIMCVSVNASQLDDLKPGGPSTPQQPANKYSDNGEAPKVEDIQKKAKTAKETADSCKWDITERDTSIRMNVGKTTTRFEVFYSASGKTPYIAFRTPEGEVYETGKDSANIITRDRNQVPGHSDLRYEVIYLMSPSSTENLNVKISLDSKTHDFFFIQSAVPQGWENFQQEYRTEPAKLILWGFHNSDNTYTDLISIVENVDIKPVEDTMGSAPPPPPVEKDNTGLIITILLIAAAGIGIMLFLNNRTKKHQAQEAQDRRVKKMNILSKKNKIANPNLIYVGQKLMI